jgi:hypothetical protein
MTDINLDSVISRAEGFSTAPVHDELMMLHVEQGAYYSLDPIAADIWSMIENPASVRDLSHRLQERYAVSAEQCQADVLEFLEDMRKNGMILIE